MNEKHEVELRPAGEAQASEPQPPGIEPLGPIDFGATDAGSVAARLIEYAAGLPASDLFLNCDEHRYHVEVRYLGILRRVTSIGRDEGRRLLNHFKAVAGMDLARKMRPEDGRWVCPRPGRESVDLRISSIPTLYGEDMAIRLLSRDLRLMALENLGLSRHDLGNLQGMLRSPGGLILVTGPAGAGKTTTLYAAINHLNDGTRRINTIEDPVEYALAGVRQAQVNLRIELDFPELLRAVLRQSSDVILVGEIRDPVTAETTVRAAASGMLVLATLHAPTAPAAINSMYALGIPPYFLASSLLGILAQRLVRTLCPQCRVAVDLSASPQTFDDVRKWLAPDQGRTIYAAAGCPACRNEGYSGRTGVFEVLRVSRELRRRIAERQTTRELRDLAVREGMLDVRRSALLKVAEGVTSIEEAMRAIPAEHLLPDSEEP
jgi:type II secretory ATPase GspE/PulE/Tfp pilus assembly ATPase PilB-like protein